MPPTKTVTHYRDAKTGRYISEEYAKEHRETTVKETDKVVTPKKPPSTGKKK